MSVTQPQAACVPKGDMNDNVALQPCVTRMMLPDGLRAAIARPTSL